MRLIFRFPFTIFILAGLMIPAVNFLAGDIHGGGIDLDIYSPTENFEPSEITLNMKPGNSVNREVQFLNKGNNPFNLFFDIEKLSGDDDFCNSLQLQYEFFYQPYPDTGPITLSDICENLMNCNAGFGTILPSGKGNLFFGLELPKGVSASLQNKTCQFNFVFLAQQILPQPCPGPAGPECPESENVLSSNVTLLYFSDTEIITNTVKSGQWVKPDFWIDKIRPVQVVWDPKIDDNDTIDLVAGKSIMVRVKVGMKNYEALDKNTQVDVRLTIAYYGFDFDWTKSKTIKELEQNNAIDFYITPLTETGDHVVRVEVDPEKKIPEFYENNNFKSLKVTVKNTNSLYLVYFPVEDYQGNKPDPTAYQKMITEGGEFVLGTYPIETQKFKNVDSEEEFKASEDLTKVLRWDRLKALVRLWLQGQRATNGMGDVAIGVVPNGSLGEGWHGFSPPIFPKFGAVFVEEKFWTLIAHEVGHIYGLWPIWFNEEYDVYGKGKKLAPGFWVDKRFEMKENAKCFMSWWQLWPKENWNWWISQGPQIVDTWICEDCYKNLFKEFLTNPTDPEVILVGGIISENSSVEFAPLYRLPAGKISKGVSNGDYLIRILDINGEIIHEVSFNSNFQEGTVPGDTGNFVPFGLSILYPPKASSIEITYKGEVITKIDPRTKLLHDAVDLIPDYAFIKNPEQLRNALHYKINAVGKMVEENNIAGAIQKLEQDIKDKLEKWLVNGYQKENSLQYSKNGIIELVTSTIEKLNEIR